MKISIIIPVYGVEKYVERCMNSVLSQIFEGEIECIIVDDCSPDSSLSLIEKKLVSYQGKIDVKILSHEMNKGISGARNTGIKAATGEYLYFLDSDDEITSDCIKLLTDIAAYYPNVDIVQGNLVITDGCYSSLDISCSDYPAYSKDVFWIKEILYSSKGDVYSMAWNKLIRRQFLIQNNLWFKEGIIYEDYHWNLFASKYIQSIAFCITPTYLYYKNLGSLTNSNDKTRNYESWLIVIEDGIKNMNDGWSYKELRHRWVNTALRLLEARDRVKDPKMYQKKYQEMVHRINRLPISWKVKMSFTLFYTISMTKWVYRIYVKIQKIEFQLRKKCI